MITDSCHRVCIAGLRNVGDAEPAAFFGPLLLPASFNVVALGESGLDVPKMHSLATWYRASRSSRESLGEAACFGCALEDAYCRRLVQWQAC